MAQFLMAKFLSQALEWKVRFPTAQFYAGLRYEPFVYEKARLAFPEYSKLYPDNKQFTEKFVRDLRNRDRELLKIISPEVVTSEHEAQDKRFETKAGLEQQQVAQIAPEQASPPFSLSTATTAARLTPIPTITGLPTQEKGESAETMEAVQEETHQQQASTPPQASTAQSSPQTQTRPKFTPPKIPLAFKSAGENFATNAGIFFKKNVGKYLTFGNALTGAFGLIGGFAGGVFTGGNPLGVLAGAGAGGIGSVWARSREGLQSMGNFANGGINSMVRISNEISRGGSLSSFAKPKNRVLWGAIGLFVFMFGFSLIGGIIAPQTTPSGAAAPVGASPSPVPPIEVSDCPIPNGVINCGSKFTPINNCGHCSVGYEQFMHLCPITPGIEYAVDIQGSDYQEIKLPKINGRTIRWTYKDQVLGTPRTLIYNGIDNETGEAYTIQFHHAQQDSGNPGTHLSGEKGGQICGGDCNQGHVHVQLASSTGAWLDAAQHFCR